MTDDIYARIREAIREVAEAQDRAENAIAEAERLALEAHAARDAGVAWLDARDAWSKELALLLDELHAQNASAA